MNRSALLLLNFRCIALLYTNNSIQQKTGTLMTRMKLISTERLSVFIRPICVIRVPINLSNK